MPKFDFKVQLNNSDTFLIIQIEAINALGALNGFQFAYPKYELLTFMNVESGGSISTEEIEINVGNALVNEYVFDVANSSITTLNTVLSETSNNTPTGKDDDELELEPITINATVPQDGIIRFTITSVDNGCLLGYYKIQYIIL